MSKRLGLGLQQGSCSVYLGYMCKKARTVAKGLSAALLVHIIREAMSFSQSDLCLLARPPPVASR